MPAWLLPAAIAGGQMFSTLLTNRANKNRQEEMNAYNSPASQLQRYKEAGMNPAYGAGMSSGNQTSYAQAQAIDVGGAVEAGSRATAWKQQYQNLKNTKIEESRLNEQVRAQKIANDLAEQTLASKIQVANLQPDIYQFNRVNALETAAIKSLDSKMKKQLFDKGYNPLIQDYQKGSADISLKAAQYALMKQQYGYKSLDNPLQYQLNQQRYEQLKITNPLDALIKRLQAEGVSSSDPLMIRLMAMSYLNGNPMYKHPLLPAAGAAALGGVITKMIPKF